MNTAFTRAELVAINQFAQGMHSIHEMQKWFLAQEETNRRRIILNLWQLLCQTHPSYAELEQACAKLNKRNCTPAVMLLNPRRPYQKYGHELTHLPITELPNAFCILLTAFKIADQRRRTECGPDCNHWWHTALPQENYLHVLYGEKV